MEELRKKYEKFYAVTDEKFNEKEKKILAAKRANINQIILCEENRKDIAEIKEAYLKGMTFHYVTDMSEVVALALTKEQVAEAKKL